MSRNGTGVFAVVNPILVGAVRSSADANENFTDAGMQITNTVPLDGQAGMTGQLKASFGNLASPGIAFATDRNVGFRRRSSDTMAWVVGNQDRLRVDADGKAWIPGGAEIAGNITIEGAVTGSSDLGQIEQLDGIGLARRIGTNTWTLDPGYFSIPVIFDGGPAPLTATRAVDIRVPIACALFGVSLLADVVGSAVVSVRKCTYSDFPTFASIIGASPPTLTNAVASEDGSLAGWTTSINAGDILRFALSSVSGLKRLEVILGAKRYA